MVLKVVPEGPRQLQSHQKPTKIMRMASRSALVPPPPSIFREKGCPGGPQGDPPGPKIHQKSIKNEVDFQVDIQTLFFHVSVMIFHGFWCRKWNRNSYVFNKA